MHRENYEYHDLRPLLAPNSIAGVGASEKPGPGRQVLENLAQLKYQGQVYPVNPGYEEILGMSCFSSLTEVYRAGHSVEMVAILLNRNMVNPVLKEAASIGVCAGCPHRSTFYLLNKLKLPVAGDIGCYNLGTLPPFRAQHTMGAMGASIGVLHGMSLAGIPEPRVCTIGDSTFFHSGMAPLVNMVHNNSRGVVILMDNSVTAMTGHQDHPGLDWAVTRDRPAKRIEIEPLVKAIGVEKVMVVDAFKIEEVEAGLKECLDYEGPSVLITRGECVFVSKDPQPAYHVDLSVCVACQLCFKVGCPAIGLAAEKNPKNNKYKSHIEPTLCTGCDICRQVCPTGAIQPPQEKAESE